FCYGSRSRSSGCSASREISARLGVVWSFFFFNDTATTEIYTLSLHDALPISTEDRTFLRNIHSSKAHRTNARKDRKSTRLNSSHANISYAVFCLKKKKTFGVMFAALIGGAPRRRLGSVGWAAVFAIGLVVFFFFF